MSVIQEEERLMKVGEVAEFLGLSKRTVYDYFNRGKLKGVRPHHDIRIFRESALGVARELERRRGGEAIPEGALDVNTIAEWLRLHPDHIRRMVAANQLPTRRTSGGRIYFDKDEVLAFFERQEAS